MTIIQPIRGQYFMTSFPVGINPLGTWQSGMKGGRDEGGRRQRKSLQGSHGHTYKGSGKKATASKGK